jgi:hypothetical protein
MAILNGGICNPPYMGNVLWFRLCCYKIPIVAMLFWGLGLFVFRYVLCMLLSCIYMVSSL